MKQVVDYVTGVHGYSQYRACRLTQQHRSTQRKVLRLDPRSALRQRMHEIVLTRLRFGYRRVHILLKREGWQVGKNVVYRLYREEGLCLRTKKAPSPQDGNASAGTLSANPTQRSMEYGFCP